MPCMPSRIVKKCGSFALPRNSASNLIQQLLDSSTDSGVLDDDVDVPVPICVPVVGGGDGGGVGDIIDLHVDLESVKNTGKRWKLLDVENWRSTQGIQTDASEQQQARVAVAQQH
jgi:hypothetical protein